MLPQFQSDVIKPMQLENIIDQDVKTLSGGELQRVAICLALGVPADIYLIDEPSGESALSHSFEPFSMKGENGSGG